MRTIIMEPFHEKTRFPSSGKNEWVVQRVKMPTMNKGSQIMWAKGFKTKKEAIDFYKRKKIK